MINFQYLRADTQKKAIDALAKDVNAQFIAGGTNLVDLMKKGVTSPQRIVDITHLPLKQIEKKPGFTSIGALALNSDVAENELIKASHPLLSLALQAGASPQLRNMATVGGNMMQRTRCTYFYDIAMPCNKRVAGSGCGALQGYNRMHAIFGASEKCIAVHPSDMCVALVALNAKVLVSGPKGNRQFEFNEFHRLPGNDATKDNVLQHGELITGIEIPDHPFTKNIYYLKIRDRASYAFALVSVAAALDIRNDVITDARLAMGGVAHKPWRLTDAEKFLKGKKVSEEVFRETAKMAMNGSKAYEHNAFKLKMAPAAIIESLKKAAKLA